MSNSTGTDRRSFLKTGALLAAPIAAVAAPAALADDGGRAKLVRLEDEKAIGQLHRTLLRRLNSGEAASCGDLFCNAKVPQLPEGLKLVTDMPGAEDPAITFADDGISASSRRECRVELETAFDGDTTVERMARLQGHGRHRHGEDRVLLSEYRKGSDGWMIESLKLA